MAWFILVKSNVVAAALNAEPCQELPEETAGRCTLPKQQFSSTSSTVPVPSGRSSGHGLQFRTAEAHVNPLLCHLLRRENFSNTSEGRIH